MPRHELRINKPSQKTLNFAAGNLPGDFVYGAFNFVLNDRGRAMPFNSVTLRYAAEARMFIPSIRGEDHGFSFPKGVSTEEYKRAYERMFVTGGVYDSVDLRFAYYDRKNSEAYKIFRDESLPYFLYVGYRIHNMYTALGIGNNTEAEAAEMEYFGYKANPALVIKERSSMTDALWRECVEQWAQKLPT